MAYSYSNPPPAWAGGYNYTAYRAPPAAWAPPAPNVNSNESGQAYNNASSAFSPQQLAAPYNAQYQQTLALAQKQLGLEKAEYKYGKNRAMQEYGYDKKGKIDSSNPFSRAQMLERSYRQQKTGDTNQYAAKGQLYAGSLQNRLDEDRFQYEKGGYQTKMSYQDLLHQLALRKQQAELGYQQAKISAEGQRLAAGIVPR